VNRPEVRPSRARASLKEALPSPASPLPMGLRRAQYWQLVAVDEIASLNGLSLTCCLKLATSNYRLATYRFLAVSEATPTPSSSTCCFPAASEATSTPDLYAAFMPWLFAGPDDWDRILQISGLIRIAMHASALLRTLHPMAECIEDSLFETRNISLPNVHPLPQLFSTVFSTSTANHKQHSTSKSILY